MLTLDFNNAIKEVLASGGQVSFKRHYRIDVDKYSWVKDFVRDQKLRKEIERLQKEIVTTQKSLIDKDELRAMFKAGIEQVRLDFFELLKGHLNESQKHECGVISGLHPYGNISSKLILASLLLVSPLDIDDIIVGLPAGVKQKEVEKTIEGIRKQIAEHNETIEKELSPQERWFYTDTGKPMPYPGGCRWTKFVEGWRKVVARFDGKVDIEGCALKTDAEFEAFYLLEMEKVSKLTPLRTPWER